MLAERRRTIVIADNDPDALELLESELRLEGHEVVGATTVGAEVVELCEAGTPEILIVDYRMPPGPNGVEIAAQVRELPSAPVVIVYTNYRHPQLRAAIEAAGAMFLPKGSLRTLRRALARV